MRITKIKLTAFRGVSSELELLFDRNGKNLLVYGENGSAKSSFARALEYLFNPKGYPDQAILAHKNLFLPKMPEIQVEFTGRKTGTEYNEIVTWTHASGKPTPSWLLMSAARSAFLDHRKLLMLSDRAYGNLPRRFFVTAVEYLFGNLTAGTPGETVSSIWKKINSDAQAYLNAIAASSSSSSSSSSGTSGTSGGISATVAHYKPIEDAVNQLNQALDDYLLSKGTNPPDIVVEAERLLQRFEGHGLSLGLQFEHLTFNRYDGSFGGGKLNPKVSYCNKPLGNQNGPIWESNHHEVLNEARLTALALALFFAAVRLQDKIVYIAGTDPDQPARLLVLDDILIGLDYAHRIPVLEIIQEEFAKDRRYQIILLTHDRVWFDVCRLQLDDKEWKAAELYARHGEGPDNTDFPIRKETSSDLLERSKLFLNQYHELPAAANYARSALETALRNICEKKGVPVRYRNDPGKHTAEEFITAIRDVKRSKESTWHLIPLSAQAKIKALRSTVLNPFSHFNPTTVTEPEIRNVINITEKIIKIAKKIKPQGD